MQAKQKPRLSVKKQKLFIADLQAAEKLTEQEVQQQNVIQLVGQDVLNRSIFFIYGLRWPKEDAALHKLKLCYINLLGRTLENGYIVIFFNTGVNRYQNLQQFLKIQSKLSDNYYNGLKEIYSVNPSFLIKSFRFFSKTGSLLQQIHFLNDLAELQRLEFFLPKFYNMIPDFVKEANNASIVPLIRHAESYNSMEIYKNQIQVYDLNLSDMKMNDQNRPAILQELFNYFLRSEESIKTEGIFRKTSSADEDKTLELNLKKLNFNYLQLNKNLQISVSSCIKKIFHTLKEPIFPYEMYDNLKKIKFENQKEAMKQIKSILNQMDDLNKDILYFLMEFLNKVAQYSQFNRVDSTNLGVLFAPCLMRPKEYTIEDLQINSITMTKIVASLIENYQLYFKPQRQSYCSPEDFKNTSSQNNSNNKLLQQMIEEDDEQDEDDNEDDSQDFSNQDQRFFNYGQNQDNFDNKVFGGCKQKDSKSEELGKQQMQYQKNNYLNENQLQMKKANSNTLNNLVEMLKDAGHVSKPQHKVEESKTVADGQNKQTGVKNQLEKDKDKVEQLNQDEYLKQNIEKSEDLFSKQFDMHKQ